MPKIRGVKPELWTDENFVELSSFARLLWIGLWNHACDNGHLQDKSKQIKMRVLPTDEVDCSKLLREIQGQGLIERAEGWITIPNLSHHQKPHRRWWSTCDKPGCDLPEGATHTPNNRGATVVPPKANRGTTADVESDVESDVDVESDGDGNPLFDMSNGAGDPLARFGEWWDAYGNKTGRHKSEIAYRAALKKPGVTDSLLIAATASYVEWCRDTNTRLKNPLTWLHGEHWRDERKSPAKPQTNTQAHLALVEQIAAEERAERIDSHLQIGQIR